MRIGLIGASTNIKNQESKARDLYSFDHYFSSLFDYAEQVLKCDKIFILSPLHGLVSPQDILPPREKSISEFEDIQRYDWSCKILEQLKNETKYKIDDFFILCDAKFYEYFIVELKKTTIPFIYMNQSEVLDKISEELAIVDFTNQDKKLKKKTLDDIEDDCFLHIKKPTKESNIDIFGYVILEGSRNSFEQCSKIYRSKGGSYEIINFFQNQNYTSRDSRDDKCEMRRRVFRSEEREDFQSEVNMNFRMNAVRNVGDRMKRRKENLI